MLLIIVKIVILLIFAITTIALTVFIVSISKTVAIRISTVLIVDIIFSIACHKGYTHALCRPVRGAQGTADCKERSLPSAIVPINIETERLMASMILLLMAVVAAAVHLLLLVSLLMMFMTLRLFRNNNLFYEALAWELKDVERALRSELQDFKNVHIDLEPW
ncbi:hypothetical protein AK812_SmicGene15646 [Symbiodinium microadriaticum]|uniref:Uncharacterized protein n=1 Tax=Symbiodinium microadriaticum TaxID=2951 RepID=A0A1Q9E2F8_SYMMI|nr:hypothetical protein AK812_SmicGene15646 [Symbiodinium microadriaticum]